MDNGDPAPPPPPPTTKDLGRTVRWVIGFWAGTALLIGVGSTLGNSLDPSDFEKFFDRLFDTPVLLPLGVGTSALIALFGILGAQRTFRAALATSMTIVFFGLLLVSEFVETASERFIDTFTWAWTLMIAFYFGTEAAVAVLASKNGDDGPPSGDAEHITVEILSS